MKRLSRIFVIIFVFVTLFWNMNISNTVLATGTANLLVNGSFSHGSLTGWTSSTTAADFSVVAGGIDDGFSLSINTTVAGNTELTQKMTTANGMLANTDYVLTYYIKGDARFTVEAVGTPAFSPVIQATSNRSKSSWGLNKLYFNSGTKSAVTIKFLKNGAAYPQNVLVDAISVYPLGDANEVANIDTSLALGSEMMYNGNFDMSTAAPNGAVGWTNNNFSTPGPGIGGTKALKLGVAANQYTSNGSHYLNLVAGKTYRFSFSTKLNIAGTYQNIFMFKLANSDGLAWSTGLFTVMNGAQTASRYTEQYYDYTPSVSASDIFIHLLVPNSSATGTIWLDNLSCKEVLSVTPTPTPTAPTQEPSASPTPGNLVINGSFADGENEWWDSNNIGTVNSTDSVDGDGNCLSLNSSVKDANSVTQAFTTVGGMLPNTEYALTYYSKGDGRTTLSVVGTPDFSPVISVASNRNLSSAWSLNRVYFNSGTKSAVNISFDRNQAVATSLLIDAVSVYPVGDVNEPPEYDTKVTLGANVVYNGGAEILGSYDGSADGWGWYDNVNTNPVVATSGPGISGSRAFLVDSKALSGSPTVYKPNQLPEKSFKLFSGKTYRIAVRIKNKTVGAVSTTFFSSLQLMAQINGASLTSPIVNVLSTRTATFSRYTEWFFDFTVPANQEWTNCRIGGWNLYTGNYGYFDDFSIREILQGKYAVDFIDWDGKVLKSEGVGENGAASAPTISPRVGYTFANWDVGFDNITADTRVTAQYSLNYHLLTFKDWDGTIISSQSVPFGAHEMGPTPPSRNDWTFSGWDTVEYLSMPDNDLIVNATYKHSVVFMDYDGVTTLKVIQLVNHGASAVAPANPTRDGYVFTGWDQEFLYVYTNLVPTATYGIARTVTFKNWDGTVLSTQVVADGGMASAPYVPPRTGYNWTGWDASTRNITSDIVITATFSIDQYYVAFYDWDYSLLEIQLITYEGSAIAPQNPTRPGYTFAGWDNTFDYIVGPMNIIATYTQNPGASVSLGCSTAAGLLTTGDTLYDDFMNLAGETTVTVQKSYFDPAILYSFAINPATKSGSIAEIPDGSYLFRVSRKGFLTRDISVTVSGENLSLGDKFLLPGELFADGKIDGSDSEILYAELGLTYSDEGYLAENDFNLDGIIDGTDTEMLLLVLGNSLASYGENVNYSPVDFKGSSLGDPSYVVFPPEGGLHDLNVTYQNMTSEIQSTVLLVNVIKNSEIFASYSIEKEFSPNEEYSFYAGIYIPATDDGSIVEVDFVMVDNLLSMKTKHDTVKNSINNVR